MLKFNFISFIIISVFILPIIIGAARAYSKERIQYALASLFNNIEILVGFIISIYLTREIFFENKTGIYKNIYELIPYEYRQALSGKDVVVYLAAVPILLVLITLVIRLVTIPFYNKILIPVSERMYNRFKYANSFSRRIIAALWQIPKAISLVLILGLFLNFYSFYFSTTFLSNSIKESDTYQFLYKNALFPVLNSNIAKQLPVLLKNSFTDNKGVLNNDNVRVIKYFNGVTLEEALKSNSEIDHKAISLAMGAKTSKEKGFLIYKWIAENIKYDYIKAEQVSENAKGLTSGAINAFTTRKGICFDFSALYVAMCRAAGLKVRLITGIAFSGIAWGDHAWNQVYSNEEKRWINVDTTFGSVANYFDKKDFMADHKNPEIQI